MPKHPPDWNDFDEVQEGILGADWCRAVIGGPPGTGKTLLALGKARELAASGRDVTVLVFNNTLERHSRDLLDVTTADAKVERAIPFFCNLVRSVTGQNAPRVDRHTPDYHACLVAMDRALQKLPEARLDRLTRDAVIVDEGQDMPDAFYEALGLITGCLWVFGDENQSINQSNSPLVDIVEHVIHGELRDACKCGLGACGVTSDELRIINRNYRNTKEVWAFAEAFMSNVRTGRATEPERHGARPRIHRAETAERQWDVVRPLLRSARAAGQSVGLLVPRKDDVRHWLERCQQEFANDGRFAVHGYSGDQDIRDAFRDSKRAIDEPGVFVTTHMSCKGLEWDTVISASMEGWWLTGPTSNRLMYVVANRPREALHFVYSGSCPDVLRDKDPKLGTGLLISGTYDFTDHRADGDEDSDAFF